MDINENKLYFNDPDKTLKKEADKLVSEYIKANNWIGVREDYVNDRIFSAYFKRENNKLEVNLEMAWYCPTNFFTYMAKKNKIDVIIAEKIEGNFTHIFYLNGKEYEGTEYNIDNILQSSLMQKASIELGLTSASEILLLAIYKNEPQLAKELIVKYNITLQQVIDCCESLTYLTDYDSYGEQLFTTLFCKDNFNTLLNNLKINAQFFIEEIK